MLKLSLITLLNLNLILASQESEIKSNLDKLKHILNNYKHSCRQKRCVGNSNVDEFSRNAIDFFSKTERYGHFLESLNLTTCSTSESGLYTRDHILKGFIIDEDMPETHWFEFKSIFDKEYPTFDHEMAALRNWRENLDLIAEHNRDFLMGKQSFTIHLNELSDFTNEEYANNFLKLIETVPLHDPFFDPQRTAFEGRRHKGTPRQVDWRAKGFKPRRERQHQCGACYAFAVAHALQAQLYKKHRDWTELSAQQIVDCSSVDGNFGCGGGSLSAAFRYVARVGLHSEKDYPYRGKKGFCHATALLPRVRPHRWALLRSGDEEAMEKALALFGPLAVAVNASPRTFQLYRGIYDDLFCTPWTLNHAMLLVGYTPHYWILLNWWGKNWGEDGYIRIRRGFNRCGVSNMAAYVEL